MQILFCVLNRLLITIITVNKGMYVLSIILINKFINLFSHHSNN